MGWSRPIIGFSRRNHSDTENHAELGDSLKVTSSVGCLSTTFVTITTIFVIKLQLTE